MRILVVSGSVSGLAPVIKRLIEHESLVFIGCKLDQSEAERDSLEKLVSNQWPVITDDQLLKPKASHGIRDRWGRLK